MKVFLYRIICGFFLGISILAPGFSGSIVAIAMGIYHDILRIISNPLKRLKENVIFFIPIGVGGIISVVLFVLAFSVLFESYEKAVYLLFVGLIAGSVPIVIKEVRKVNFKLHYLIGAVGAFIIAIAIGIFATEAGLMTVETTPTSNLPGFALGGFAAGVTALIPGMSLSTILVLLGVYSPLIYAARALLSMELLYLIPIGLFIVCTVVGLMATARGIKYLFNRYPGFANTTVLGFIFGSLISIMYQSHHIEDPNFTWLLGGIMLIAGLGISILFIVIGRFMNKNETEKIE